MTLNSWIFIGASLLFSFHSKAQNSDDLGSTKPFLIGLKGAIYDFKMPRTYADVPGRPKSIPWDSVGYTLEYERKKPIGYVYTQSLNITERDLTQPFPGVPRHVKYFAIIYRGKFEVSEDATYDFAIKSDDGSKVWVDSMLLINHDGIHNFSQAKKGSIALKKGFHDLKVWYFQGLVDRMGLMLMWRSTIDKVWKPFDLKPVEDDFRKNMHVDSSTANIQLSDKLLFEVGKASLKSEAKTALSQLLKLLLSNPTATLRIEGHTDNKGSAASNQVLSENRAKAVATALKEMGMPETVKIETKGYGFTQPIAPNTDEAGKAKNRRVDITVSLN
jgi:outer membrane protein OmpA-like peptidoglycan-associated protein